MVSNGTPAHEDEACRVILQLTDEHVFRMKRMMLATGSADFTEVVRKALALQEKLINEVKQGREIMIVDNKGMNQTKLELVVEGDDAQE